MEEPSAATNGHTVTESQPAEAAAAPPADVDPEVKQLVFEWITETLHKAWRSKEESDKKKVIKQLMLKWHPDKNQDDPALALVATQYIQSEIERLENGLPARTRSAGATSYHRTFNTNNYTFHRRNQFDDDDDYVQQKYESMYKSFSEQIRKKREEFERQFDERERAAKLEQRQRAREREEQWRRFEDQRREREREAKEERDRQQQKAKERREQFDRDQRKREEFMREQRQRRFDRPNDTTQNGHSSMNGDAKPRESLHTTKRSETNGTAQLTDEEKVAALLEQAGHDLKAAENDMNLEVPAHEWACFKAHQVRYLARGRVSVIPLARGRVSRHIR
jgi:hypothetical protein